jgi:hypothetical protein
LLALDPVARHVYQHKEYWPLVSPRMHQLGRVRRILNEDALAQYNQFLAYLAYRPALDAMDQAVVATYLLMQDRVEEALKFFGRITPDQLPGSLPYDYLKAYLLMSQEKVADARTLAGQYRDYPVDRWRNLFQDVLAQLDEIEGQGARVVDKEDRGQLQTRLADTEAGFDVKVENRAITIHYQNLAACRVNYYPMDLEQLFSRNAFVQEVSGQFAVIQPADSADVALPKDKNTVVVDLPKVYQDRNVMIEVTGGGAAKSQPYYPNSLNVQMLENYGQVKVLQEKTDKPLAKVYVKVYARSKDGSVKFYKDGYTDLRGRFDYSSLNTGDIESVERFSILIMSEQFGAVVREAAPPKM